MSNLLNIQPRESLQMGRMLVSNPAERRAHVSGHQAWSGLTQEAAQGPPTPSSPEALSLQGLVSGATESTLLEDTIAVGGFNKII